MVIEHVGSLHGINQMRCMGQQANAENAVYKINTKNGSLFGRQMTHPAFDQRDDSEGAALSSMCGSDSQYCRGNGLV